MRTLPSVLVPVLALAGLAACSAPSSSAPPSGNSPSGTAAGVPSARGLDPRTDIAVVLHAQQDAWNRGDLAAFMELGYQRSPELTFFSGGEVSRGFDEMLARYRKNYEGPDKELGALTFGDIEVVMLTDDAALARGRWDLDYASKKDVGGLFTLVLRRLDGAWRIVHDHTSVDG